MKFKSILLPLFSLTLLALLIATLSATPPAANAADWTVADEASLVEAISAANAAGAGEHTITMTAAITLTAPLPAINNIAATRITLDGGSFILNAAGTGTALVVRESTTVTIQNITITGGAGSSLPDGQSGGGVANRGNLTIVDSTITGNSARNGGGIINYGDNLISPVLLLDGVQLIDNEATNFGGGLYNYAGGGTVAATIRNSTFLDNVATDSGGGLYNQGASGAATIDLTDSTVAGNISTSGGGIFNNGNNGEAVITLNRAALIDNEASNQGGGLFNNGNLGRAAVSITNSTIFGNNAGLSGGGLHNSPNSGEADLSLLFTTLDGNTAPQGGGIFNLTGGTVNLSASIVSAGEIGAACATSEGAIITSGGYNIDTDDSCGLTETGDLPGGNPALEPPALNAPGTTQTQAIGQDSDAHSQVPTGTLGCGTDIVTDQRGATRPSPEPLCDIGAYESDYSDVVPPPPPTCEAPYLPATEVELNAAIACVNDAGPGSHVVTLATNINLTAPTTAITNTEATEILLDGDGFVLNGNLSGTVVTIEPETTVRLLDIIIAGGRGSGGPTDDWGGGVFNRGHLTIESSTLTNNTAARGGGVANVGAESSGGTRAVSSGDTAATLTIIRSTLSGNTATTDGGGILNTSSGEGVATLAVVNSTLSGNAAAAGGGLFNEATGGSATANLNYATVADNTAGAGGGGIHTVAGDEATSTVTLTATIVVDGPGTACAVPSGSIFSGGYNLDDDDTCRLHEETEDLPAADAKLLPLALNAPGKTATHALSDDSDALNVVPIGFSGCGSTITIDQRGLPRPQEADGFCDSGAFELTEAPTSYFLYLPMASRPGGEDK